MDEEENPIKSVGDGVALAFANVLFSSLALVAVGFAIGSLGKRYGYALAFVAVLGFGAAQIPGVIFLAVKNKNNPKSQQGLIITSSILLLLNAGCWGFFLTSMRR